MFLIGKANSIFLEVTKPYCIWGQKNTTLNKSIYSHFLKKIYETSLFDTWEMVICFALRKYSGNVCYRCPKSYKIRTCRELLKEIPVTSYTQT
jgi:hypothetical protein